MKYGKLNILNKIEKCMCYSVLLKIEKSEEHGEVFLWLLRILQAVFGSVLCSRTL